MSNLPNKPSIFINVVDKDMHDNLLRLDQKLKGLQMEIQVKIDTMSNENDELSKTRKSQLMVLAQEVNKALDSISGLINTVIPEQLSTSEFSKMNHEELEAFREMIIENTKKIIKIKEEF